MRRINSDFQTLHISEEGQKLSNRDYFGYVEMDDFACYVLADSLDDEPAACLSSDSRLLLPLFSCVFFPCFPPRPYLYYRFLFV